MLTKKDAAFIRRFAASERIAEHFYRSHPEHDTHNIIANTAAERAAHFEKIADEIDAICNARRRAKVTT